ncbi:hypothetical protein [Methylobacterium nonmethylotrophicum]|uniref:Uncharacterized protein n=1 Tax=Methylobacterium nonmethylotrophicum TaxID=1141884 RepID=A0A4Z0NJ87_9HYPH|nr:hypothetical protein [Methylobacterium nonmethylotrophicum]TGD95755.1 hypothetical protein EU555_26310 [Methylobacterium nonmethylotrophicum]
MKILSSCLVAAVLTVAAVPAFAQGGSPYNNSGSQAGGPLAGQQREMGAGGGSPAMGAAPRSTMKPMMRKQRMMKHRRTHRHAR